MLRRDLLPDPRLTHKAAACKVDPRARHLQFSRSEPFRPRRIP
jgi:hypothetical protein